MRRLVAGTVVLLVFAVPAQAANAPNLTPRVHKLERQVAALTRQVHRMTVLSLQQQADLAQETEDLTTERDLSTCRYAVLRDSLDSQYHTLGLVVQAVTGQQPPPDLPRFDDTGACGRVGVTR